VCIPKTNGSPSLALIEVKILVARGSGNKIETQSRTPYFPIKPNLSLLIIIFESAAEMLLKN
jgi:hypothetical protein